LILTKLTHFIGVAMFLAMLGLATGAPAQDLEAAKKAFMLGDYATAHALWSQAAADGDPEAMNNLGILYNKGLGVERDIEAAARLYLQAANLGFPNAQFNLANLHYNGDGLKRDYAEAARWYLAAAQGGHALAQLYLAEMYETGQGIARDEAEALRWYKASADSKLAGAEYEFARRLLFGDGVAPDPPKAYEYLIDAGFQGHAQSQALLGRAYARGIGGAVRRVEAYAWLGMAARRLKPGKELNDVTDQLRAVESQFTPDERAAAEATLVSFEGQTPGGADPQ
jgi:TPR repeat protein